MVPLEDLAVLAPGATLYDALSLMDEKGINQVPIVDENRLVGILTREKMIAVLNAHLELVS